MKTNTKPTTQMQQTLLFLKVQNEINKKVGEM